MSDSRHTPGPWVVTTDLRQDDEIICDMLNEQGYVAITKGQKLANWRDDAKLIAAAPDLLEALQELRDLMQGVIDGEYEPDFATLQIADAAIAKATA